MSLFVYREHNITLIKSRIDLLNFGAHTHVYNKVFVNWNIDFLCSLMTLMVVRPFLCPVNFKITLIRTLIDLLNTFKLRLTYLTRFSQEF